MKVRFIILLLSLGFCALSSNASEEPNLEQDLRNTNTKAREILNEIRAGVKQPLTDEDKESLLKKVAEVETLRDKRNELRKKLRLEMESSSDND